MPTVRELMRSGRKEELWQMCCGFLDLDIDQFMVIQSRLLLEQIELLNNSLIGRKIFGGTIPQDVAQFRKRVPLTTYKDYCPELSERRDDALPVKPVYWQHTSGRSADFPFKWENIKWIPITPGYCRELGNLSAGYAMIAACKKKGDTSGIAGRLNYIYAVAPRPYTSGTLAHIATEALGGVSLPPLEQAEKMTFEERIETSIRQAASQGFDFYFGVTVALVAIGERVIQQVGKVNPLALMSQPRALFRFGKGIIKSKIARRKLLPKDIWSLKGIICSGTDGAIFRDLIRDTWGKYPLNMYASTEGGIMAAQTWDYSSMTFNPSLNFLEFIPEAEYEKSRDDSSYQPRTVLLSEVEAGQRYELVISNFYGSPLTRYRTGDVIKISALKNDNLDINLPQMEFEGRVDDILDIGGFIRLTEKVIWQAVSNTGIPYVDWAATRETIRGLPVLQLFIEPKEEQPVDSQAVAAALYAELKKMDVDFMYGNIEDFVKTMPIKVTILPKGAFEHYINLRRSQGSDLAHLKPRHINPTAKELSILRMTTTEQEETRESLTGIRATGNR